MKYSKVFLLIFLLGLSTILQGQEEESKVNVLLIGDSTTIGGKRVLDKTIEDIINSDKDTPDVNVIISAKGGETAHQVIESGRYDKDIKPLKDIDYIFVRYGINDTFKRKPLKENFPGDYQNLISKLQEDFPKAKLILMTITPFFDKVEKELEANELIKQVAEKNNLELFDIYPIYVEGLKIHGKNSMNVRFVPLESIPEHLRAVAKPFTKYVEWKDTDMVRVLTNELDPLFNDVEGWYRDRHPNPTGYRLLALATANYLIPKLKK